MTDTDCNGHLIITGEQQPRVRVLPPAKQSRTFVVRKMRELSGYMGNTQDTGTGVTSILDLLLPKDAQGKPVAIMEHSVSTQSIIYLGLAALAAGLAIKHV